MKIIINLISLTQKNLRKIKQFLVDSEAITLSTGSYEIEDIESYLIKHLKEKNLLIMASNNTLKSTIKFDTAIDFRPANSIGRL